MGLREEFEAWLLTDYRNDLYGAFEAGWNRRASPASVPANADLTGAKASALKAQLYGENMMTIECDFEGFKRMAKEFHDAAPTLNLDELDNAWKCLGLGYLGMNEPMWQHSAATLLKLEARTFAERESALTYNFKMVPVEPTMEMCEAGWNEYDLQEHFSVRFMYERMIAAAPTPPVSEDRKDAERYRWLRSVD